MKPYSPKPSGSQKGTVSLTSNCPTRKRALKRDKWRREGKTDFYPSHDITAGRTCLCYQCCDDRDNGRI